MAAGFRHPIQQTSQPVSEDFNWPETDDDFQFSATELRQVIEPCASSTRSTGSRRPKSCGRRDSTTA